jgi:hypothetical protein
MSGTRRGAAQTLVAAAALAALLFACGRKASPRPPQFVIPRSPEPVQVSAVPDGLKVTWHRPKTYVDGTSLDDLGSFLVLRSCAPEWMVAPIAQLPVTDRERFRKGMTFSLVDHDVGPHAECVYQVIATTTDDYSSPPAEGVFPPPPPTPTPEPSPTPTFDENGSLVPATPVAEQATPEPAAPEVGHPTPDVDQATPTPQAP